MERRPQIYFCYDRSDIMKVKRLYQLLPHEDFKLWMDFEDISVGEKWQERIGRAIKSSDCILIFLSSHSVSRREFISYIRYAIDILQTSLHSNTSYIVIRLEFCYIPEILHDYPYVDIIDVDLLVVSL